MSDDFVVLDGITFDADDFLADGGYGYLGEVIVGANAYSRFIAMWVAGINELDTLKGGAEGFRDEAEGFRDEAQAFALAAQAGADELQGTSTSSITIGAGAKTAVIQSGHKYVAGMGIHFARTSAASTQWMTGYVDSVAGTTVNFTVGSEVGNDYQATGGTGPYTDWTYSFSGWEGPRGPAGADQWSAPTTITTGTTTPAAGITGGVIYIADVTSGPVTIDLTNSPGGVMIKLKKTSASDSSPISPTNYVRIIPPTGKKLYNQATNNTVTRTTEFDTWAVFKDSNGDYA